MGIPQDGNQNIYSGFQACSRIKGVTNKTNTAVSFSVKLIQPNDTWCNYTWWTPIIEPAQTLSYMIMERGHYNLTGAEFDIRSARYTGHCTYFNQRHLWLSRFGAGVVPAVIMQHQTMKDKRFVSYRVLQGAVGVLGVTFYIQLHNPDKKWHPRLGDCVGGHYLDHYDNNRWRQAYTIDFETVSVLGYTPEYIAQCSSGIAFESHILYGVTSDPRWLPFYWYYTGYPGVFGMVNSFNGGDSVTLRSFNHTLIGVGVILQEDQCGKQSILHTAGETMAFFVIGPMKFTKVNPYVKYAKAVSGNCMTTFTLLISTSPTGQPTVVPTSRPTARPTAIPTSRPNIVSTSLPTTSPTVCPSSIPTSI